MGRVRRVFPDQTRFGDTAHRTRGNFLPSPGLPGTVCSVAGGGSRRIHPARRSDADGGIEILSALDSGAGFRRIGRRGGGSSQGSRRVSRPESPDRFRPDVRGRSGFPAAASGVVLLSRVDAGQCRSDPAAATFGSTRTNRRGDLPVWNRRGEKAK